MAGPGGGATPPPPDPHDVGSGPNIGFASHGPAQSQPRHTELALRQMQAEIAAAAATGAAAPTDYAAVLEQALAERDARAARELFGGDDSPGALAALRRLSDAQRASLMAKDANDETSVKRGFVDAGTINVGSTGRPDSGADTAGVQRSLAELFGVPELSPEEEKEYDLLCDKAQYDSRFGWYTPGLSRVRRTEVKQKVERQGFTYYPLHPPRPAPTIPCDYRGIAGAPCDYLGYTPAEVREHAARKHAEEFRARDSERFAEKEAEQVEQVRRQNEMLRVQTDTLVAQNRTMLAILERIAPEAAAALSGGAAASLPAAHDNGAMPGGENSAP
jgi:hypothetical protein